MIQWKKNYNCDFYYDNGLLKYIVLVKSKQIHLPLIVIWYFQNTIKEYNILLQTIDIWNKCEWNNGNKILWVCFLLWWHADKKLHDYHLPLCFPW